MSSTYTKLYAHVIIVVKHRENILLKPWRDELFKYMAGTIKSKNQKPIIVNGVEDHVHLFIGMRPSMSISDLIRDVKNNASNYINKYKLVKGRFSWQEGFAAFSYAHSEVENVYNYILNQEIHHRKKGFKEEYLELLRRYDVDYEEQYLFDSVL